MRVRYTDERPLRLDLLLVLVATQHFCFEMLVRFHFIYHKCCDRMSGFAVHAFIHLL